MKKSAYKNTFGFKFKSARLESGKSQREIAEMVGKSPGLIGAWEGNRSNPALDSIKILEKAYPSLRADFNAFKTKKSADNGKSVAAATTAIVLSGSAPLVKRASNFPEALRTERERKGLSIVDLSAKVKLSAQTLISFERGVQKPYKHSYEALVNAFPNLAGFKFNHKRGKRGPDKNPRKRVSSDSNVQLDNNQQASVASFTKLIAKLLADEKKLNEYVALADNAKRFNLTLDSLIEYTKVARQEANIHTL